MNKSLVNYLKMLVLDLPREFWADAEGYLKQLLDARKVRRVVRLARMKTQVDRKHRYVIRNFKGDPVAVTAIQINILRRKGILPKNVSCVSVYTNAIEVVKYNHGYSNQKGSGVKVRK